MDVRRELAKSAAEKRAEPAPRWHERAREWLSLYRILYALALSFNIAGVVALLPYKWHVGREHAATFALGNIILSVLWRNEVFVRAIYVVLLSLFKRWPPLAIRNALSTFMLHIGGLHSGFATAGFLWLVAATVELYRQGARITHVAILVMSVITCALVFLVMLSAYPAVRTSHHNTFENVHRFFGWTGIAAVWVVVTTSQTWNASTQRFEGHRLWMHADIYLTFFLTFLIILPWTTLRKAAVGANVVSGSVVILRFRGGMRPGLFGRVARTPLSDYHAFGIVSHGPRTSEHYMCVVGQGDFTRRLVADPPTHLWTRSLTRRYPRNIETTYLDTVLPDLRNAFAPDDADGASYTRNVTVWDTRIQGRPNTVQLINRIVQTHDLEVVFVTSNPKGTAEILRGCRKLSIPVHGPIWDS
ncbi:hypothetical protein EXIGLDRAFT_688846 [Exidia glandulosa HHB12029]|uniref:Uncharacterized protein n=1 Tax=Exidia glandulosa HHB12029 TaxID=1314781 RepID=A0A166NLX6_EXIGL|nr:hypothetical protein EXIGLDRAFT_688846 [Exidia glandulosa HHB12029]